MFISAAAEGEQPRPAGGPRALPVYNQAYQENYKPDSLELITVEARNAYILMDPFGDEDLSPFIPLLKERGNQLSAYISVGTGEEWRSDFDRLKPYLTQKQWDEWKGEFYISDPGTEVMAVMKARIDRIVLMGFDWVEFDNMDWIFDEETRSDYGLKATREEGLAYIQALRAYAASKGLKCMAKNWRSGAENFDGITFESYSRDKNWWDRDDLKAFLDEGKPGIIIHYKEKDCDGVYREYMEIYGNALSFIAESRSDKAYIHYNQ